MWDYVDEIGGYISGLNHTRPGSAGLTHECLFDGHDLSGLKGNAWYLAK